MYSIFFLTLISMLTNTVTHTAQSNINVQWWQQMLPCRQTVYIKRIWKWQQIHQCFRKFSWSLTFRSGWGHYTVLLMATTDFMLVNKNYFLKPWISLAMTAVCSGSILWSVLSQGQKSKGEFWDIHSHCIPVGTLMPLQKAKIHRKDIYSRVVFAVSISVSLPAHTPE